MSPTSSLAPLSSEDTVVQSLTMVPSTLFLALATLAISPFIHAAPVHDDSFDPFPFDANFDIRKVIKVATNISSHSWEFGTAAEALLEIYNPELSVFGECPFPVPTLKKNKVKSLAYGAKSIVIGTGPNALSNGTGAIGDPANLGVCAVMLGKTEPKYAAAAHDQLTYTIYDAPRMPNDAISTRVDVQEIWADFMNMFPPFYAYYAADICDLDMLEDAYRQCGLYREILKPNITEPYNGVWYHIYGPQSQDLGLWSTSNGWSSMGMTRVLATIMKAPVANGAIWREQAIADLTEWIKEIVEGAMNAPPDTNHLLRNYLNDTGPHGFGEFSGTAMISAVVYRMAVIQPDVFTESHVSWAEKNLMLLAEDDPAGYSHVSENGTVRPTVNPLGWGDTVPFLFGSPEGQSFVALLYAAWRDYKIYFGK